MNEVWVAVIVAVITGIFALAGQMVLSRSSYAKVLSEIEKRSEISDVKMEGQIEKMQSMWELQMNQLAASVNKHNAFGERIPVLEEKIRVLDNRVSELERRE